MGCCISKCKPKKALVDEFNFVVQDKLVISDSSQPTKLTSHHLLSNKLTPLISLPRNIPTFSNKISPLIFPPPSSPSNSSLSSSLTSATTPPTTNTVSSSSSLSTSSSSKVHRSFSNEFLQACFRDNPHILRINSIREHSLLSLPPTKLSYPHVSSSSPLTLAGSGSGSGSGSRPGKRVRASSPSHTPLTRQRSSRSYTHYSPSRTHALRSPSPSRRFSVGALTNPSIESCAKVHVIGSKLNAARSSTVLSCTKQESFRPASPMSSVKKKETRVHRVSSKIDETAVADAISSQESCSSTADCIPMEDIDNPLISLDCFIFI